MRHNLSLNHRNQHSKQISNLCFVLENLLKKPIFIEVEKRYSNPIEISLNEALYATSRPPSFKSSRAILPPPSKSEVEKAFEIIKNFEKLFDISLEMGIEKIETMPKVVKDYEKLFDIPEETEIEKLQALLTTTKKITSEISKVVKLTQFTSSETEKIQNVLDKYKTVEKKNSLRDQITAGEDKLQNLKEKIAETDDQTELKKLLKKYQTARDILANNKKDFAALSNVDEIDNIEANKKFYEKDLEFFQKKNNSVRAAAFNAISKVYFFFRNLLLVARNKKNQIHKDIADKLKQSEIDKIVAEKTKSKKFDEKQKSRLEKQVIKNVKKEYQELLKATNEVINELINTINELNKLPELDAGYASSYALQSKAAQEKSEAETEKLNKETEAFQQKISPGFFTKLLKKIGLAEQQELLRQLENSKNPLLKESIRNIKQDKILETAKRWQHLAGIKKDNS